MNIIMSIAWQATGFILLCLTFIVIVLNCTVFADDIEESENWDEKKIKNTLLIDMINLLL